MPFFATPSRVVRALRRGSGQSITLGLTLVWTASSTFRPARSMAVAVSQSRSILARWATMRAWTTRRTLPCERKSASKAFVEISGRPAVLLLPRLDSRFADRESSQTDESADSEAAKIICVGFKFGMKSCSNRHHLKLTIIEPAVNANSNAVIFGNDFAHSKTSD